MVCIITEIRAKMPQNLIINRMSLGAGAYSTSLVEQAGFSLRILVAGERCNVTGEYFERGLHLRKK